MAERRMFAKTIINSDPFGEMPLSAQALYFHLAMGADDDGFINNANKIRRSIGASEDDLRLLLAKRFILVFESGVVVIKHWKVHNYIRSDRYKPTVYISEKNRLKVKQNGTYTERVTDGIPSDYQMDTQCRLGYSQDSLESGQDSVAESSVPATDGDGDCPVEKDVENHVEKYGKQLEVLHGTLGKGVVRLTQEQMNSLIDKIGISDFDEYMVRLANFIIENDAHVKNHYDTILKWWREDTAIES